MTVSFEKEPRAKNKETRNNLFSLFFFLLSVINFTVSIVLNYYQLAFLTPGIRPLLAISLKVTLESPKVLM